MKKLLALLVFLLVLLVFGSSNGLLQNWRLKTTSLSQMTGTEKVKIISEESAVISAIDKALPSVVTVGISKTTSAQDLFELNPSDPFSPFRRIPGEEQKVEQNIGSGFIIAENGLIVTNKHVVADTEATYKILTSGGKTYEVKHISRDPLNDLAILKIDANNLQPLKLGNSSNLKLGQLVMAIGTPLGEFTNTVTSGIISGLKRGVVAGSPYAQYVERLDNVIQTDAAISPGNSGGPLINSLGEAIGVNTAVSQSGQNIGFAIPIQVVKDLIGNYNKSGGTIERPFLGIRYQMITKQNAIVNEVSEGAYVVQVVDGSPAQKAGIVTGDIIIDFDGHRIKGDDDKTLQKLIASHKIGDHISLKLYRDGKTIEKTVTLEIFK